MKKDFVDFIITSWNFIGEPLENVTYESPLSWAGGPHLPASFPGGLAKNKDSVDGVIRSAAIYCNLTGAAKSGNRELTLINANTILCYRQFQAIRKIEFIACRIGAPVMAHLQVETIVILEESFLNLAPCLQ